MITNEIMPIIPTKSRTIRYTGFDKCEPRWYVVRTSFRHEKSALRDLERQGLVAWLPLMKETRRYDRKYREVEIPVLGSYLFVHINERGYYPVIQSPYINSFLRFGEDILPVPEEEMELLRLIVGETAIINAVSKDLVVGDMVEIIGGKLTGIRGVLEAHRNHNQVSISLHSLGCTLILEVDPKFLRRI